MSGKDDICEFWKESMLYSNMRAQNSNSPSDQSTDNRKERTMDGQFGNFSDEFRQESEENYDEIPEETIQFEHDIRSPEGVLERMQNVMDGEIDRMLEALNEDKIKEGVDRGLQHELPDQPVQIMDTKIIPGVDARTAEHISSHVDQMMEKEEMPGRAGLKPIRKFDDLKDKDPDEAEARAEHAHWYLNKDDKVLDEIGHTPHKWNAMQRVPKQIDETGNDVSHFNTHDFKKANPGLFEGEHWKTQNVLEKTFDIATSHSAISDEIGKKNQEQKFEDMMRTEFLNKIVRESNFLKSKSPDVVNRASEKIDRLQNNLNKARNIWREHAFKQ